MSTPLHFRPATHSDRERLHAMMREFYAHEGILPDLPTAKIALEPLLADEQLGTVWLIGREGETAPVGYVVVTYAYSLEYGGKTALIDEVYVAAENRRSGIGAAVMDFLERRLRDEDVGAMFLVVDRENSFAQGLYRKRGFTGQGRELLVKKMGAGQF